MNKRLRGLAVHAILILVVLVLVFPFYWTVVMATNTTSDFYVNPPKLTIGGHLLDNIGSVISKIDLFGSMLNTVIVAVLTTALVLFLDSLAAFAFAKFRFPRAADSCSDCCSSCSCCRPSCRRSRSSSL